MQLKISIIKNTVAMNVLTCQENIYTEYWCVKISVSAACCHLLMFTYGSCLEHRNVDRKIYDLETKFLVYLNPFNFHAPLIIFAQTKRAKIKGAR